MYFCVFACLDLLLGRRYRRSQKWSSKPAIWSEAKHVPLWHSLQRARTSGTAGLQQSLLPVAPLDDPQVYGDHRCRSRSDKPERANTRTHDYIRASSTDQGTLLKLTIFES